MPAPTFTLSLSGTDPKDTSAEILSAEMNRVLGLMYQAFEQGLSDLPNFGSAATADSTDFATSEQGELADSAVQPDDLGTAATADVGAFATAAQGERADSAVQPDGLGTAATAASSDFATAAQGSRADTAVQPDTLSGFAAKGHGHDFADVDGLAGALVAARAGAHAVPGDHPSRFNSSTTGVVAYDISDVGAAGGGRGIALTKAGVVAMGDLRMIGPDDVDSVRGLAQRVVAVLDPAGDGIELAVACFGADGQPLGGASASVVLASVSDVSAAGAVFSEACTVGLAVSEGVDVVLPAGTVFHRPFIRAYGGNPQLVVQGLQSIRVTGVSSGSGVSFDHVGADLAGRDAFDGSDEGTTYAHPDGTDLAYYVRTAMAGAWVGPFGVRGPQGASGSVPEAVAPLVPLVLPDNPQPHDLLAALSDWTRQQSLDVRKSVLRSGFAAAPDVVTNAVSFELRDLATGDVLLSKSPDTPVLPASTTKVMSLLCAIEAIGVSAFRTGSVTVPNDSAYFDGFLVRSGDVFDLMEAGFAFMLPSNNAIGNVLAFAAFPSSADPIADLVAAMNAKAAALGMDDTNYVITFGDSSDGNTTITAHDSCTLAAHVAAGGDAAAILVGELWSEGQELITIDGPQARVVELNHTVDMVQSGDYNGFFGFNRIRGGKTGHSGAASGYVHMLHVTSTTGQGLALVIHKADTDIARYRDFYNIMSVLDASYEWIDGIALCSRKSVVRPAYSWLLQDAAPQIQGVWSRDTPATVVEPDGAGGYVLNDAISNAPRLSHNAFFGLLEGVLLEPERENYVRNSMGKGAVVSDGQEINPDVDMNNGTGWTETSSGGTAVFAANGLTLTGTGAARGSVRFEIPTDEGHYYVLNFPQGVSGSELGWEIGTAPGGSDVEFALHTAGPYRANMFRATVTGTTYLELFKFANEAVTVPRLEILHCGRLPDDWEWYGLYGAYFTVETAARTVEGADAIDVRFRGTPSVNGNAFLNFGSPRPAVRGQKVSLSAYNKRLSGSTSNVAMRQRLIMQDFQRNTIDSVSSGVLTGVGAVNSPSDPLLKWRSNSPLLVGDPRTEFVEFGLQLDLDQDQAFDITIQIANPQMELRSDVTGAPLLIDGRTSVIRSDPDDPATWVRAADGYQITDLEPGVYDQIILGADQRILGGEALPRQRVEVGSNRRLHVQMPPQIDNERILHTIHLAPVY